MMPRNKLEIKSNDALVSGSKVLLNGEEFPITDIEIKGNAKGVWKAKVEFFVKDGLAIELDNLEFVGKKNAE